MKIVIIYFSYSFFTKLNNPPILIKITDIQIHNINGLTWYLTLNNSWFGTKLITINLSDNRVVLISASLVTIFGWLYILSSGDKFSILPFESWTIKFPIIDLKFFTSFWLMLSKIIFTFATYIDYSESFIFFSMSGSVEESLIIDI